MPYLSIRDALAEEKKHYRLIKISLSFSMSMLGLYLISVACMSVRSSLDKPIPTGSVSDLLAYASGALYVATLIVCGAFAIFLNIKYLQHVRSEHRAKMISAEVIARIAAMAKEETATERATHIKLTH